jgi:putative membrane protein
MVSYNPKDWFKLIFQFHKSDTFRMLMPTMLILGVITGGYVKLEQHYPVLQVQGLVIFHQLSGFMISMVLVFRINSAYDRWWEGRKLWGSLLNHSRILAVRAASLTADFASRAKCAALITNFAIVLKNHLRDQHSTEELLSIAGPFSEQLASHSHKPNFVLQQLHAELKALSKDSPSDMLPIAENIQALADICGGCERIRHTPIPFSYSIFIKKIIFLYVITLPLGLSVNIGYFAIPVVMFLFYAFASLELISEEIEDPFGIDANDLPTDELTVKIKVNTAEILNIK